MNLAEIQEKVHTAQGHCWDSEILLGEIADCYEGKFDMAYDRQMTAVARHEMLSKIGVPTKYQGQDFFDRLSPTTQRMVVQDAVSPKRDKMVLARWYGETLRAVVSGDYTCVPHTSVVDVLTQFPSFEVKNFYPSIFGPETKTMHIRLTTPQIHSLNGNGDKGKTMIHVVNSEIGKGSLIVDAGIWREVCTNGLFARIGGQLLLMERHLYHGPDDLLEVFGTAIEQAEHVATDFAEKLRAARRMSIPVSHVLAQLPSDRMRKQVRDRLTEGTLFDVYNAVTAAAQEYTFISQVEWERWARRLLDQDWSGHVHEDCPACGRTL